MPFSKITTKHQVTIPQDVFEELKLNVGDHVEVIAAKGRVIMTPHRMVPREPAVRLSEKEQKILITVRQKIKAIQEDMIHSTGLTREEADVAAKVGLIAKDQRWWWLEQWQEGEREAERDEQEGRYTEFDSPEEFLKHLRSL